MILLNKSNLCWLKSNGYNIKLWRVRTAMSGCEKSLSVKFLPSITIFHGIYETIFIIHITFSSQLFIQIYTFISYKPSEYITSSFGDKPHQMLKVFKCSVKHYSYHSIFNVAYTWKPKLYIKTAVKTNWQELLACFDNNSDPFQVTLLYLLHFSHWYLFCIKITLVISH